MLLLCFSDDFLVGYVFTRIGPRGILPILRVFSESLLLFIFSFLVFGFYFIFTFGTGVIY